jgi:hypothetical protein
LLNYLILIHKYPEFKGGELESKEGFFGVEKFGLDYSGSEEMKKLAKAGEYSRAYILYAQKHFERKD